MSLTPRLDQIDTNYVINGDMYYWQRGTTGTVARLTANGDGWTAAYVADRAKVYVERASGGFSSVDVSVQVDRSIDIPNTQFVYSHKVTSNLSHNLGNSGSIIIPYHTFLEGTTLANLKYNDTVYISFWVKSNIQINNFNIALQLLGTSGFNSYNTLVNIPANTWTYVKKTITLPNYQFYKDNNLGIRLMLGAISGSNATFVTSITDTWLAADKFTVSSSDNWASTAGNYIQITGVKLSKYAHDEFSLAGRNHLEELRLCQRYYNIALASGGGEASSDSISANRDIRVPVAFPVQMRTLPSINTADNFAGINITVVSALDITKEGYSLRILRGGQGLFYISINSKQDAEF